MNKNWYFVTIQLVIVLANGLPTNFQSEDRNPLGVQSGTDVNTSQILGFMRKFGYLSSSSTTFTSETLYHQDAIIAAVKNMQRYGALNETGVLDSETLKLLTAPRCGLPDIQKGSTNDNGKRHKRFVLGSQGWQKRHLTYFISNWSPKVGQEKVAIGMEQAFGLWSKYSGLRFERVYHSNADIIVAFGSGFHGDAFPFDGPGRILAHAFFPYEMTSFGGDIHFDNDENWIENASNLAEGVDFRSVAVHELGHSLGLAHSSAFSSIMFPYYKGPEETKDLDYDDIMALYELYIKSRTSIDETNPNPGIDTETEEDVEISSATTASPTESLATSTTPIANENSVITTDTITPDVRIKTTDSGTVSIRSVEISTIPTTDNVPKTECSAKNTYKHRFSFLLKCMSATETPMHTLPNLCEDARFDAIASMRGEIFVFRETNVWRFTEDFQLIPGYPTHFRDIFQNIPNYVQKIDAAYERFTDGAIILFSGKQFWVFDGLNFIENSPRSISEYGFDESTQKVDAAMIWSKNSRTYIFSGMKFTRFDEERHSVEQGYPKNINENWHGIPNYLDAAISMNDEKTFFFKGDLFWLYDDHWLRPQNGYPRRTSISWFGCSE